MPEQRPDPDQLLAQVQEASGRAGRGRLKIFFGACAGVGKTYAMLSAARALAGVGPAPTGANSGDILVGIVETHGRAETEALLPGLARLPPQRLSYKGSELAEFDLDAALARRPALILVDELAHSNLAGCRHPKRWQDVEELLAAGIDVWTTMNVQHLESLNDIVGGITGIRVWETVPDRVFDAADEVVIVDLPPDDLLRRLKEGRIYLPRQAEQAVRNFFRKGNLIALRELALRRTADRVDSQMQRYRQRGAPPPAYGNREALLVCLGTAGDDDKTLRSTARLAAQLDATWHAVHVETPGVQRQPQAARERALRLLRLAQEMGAETATLAGQEVAGAVVEYARRHNLARVLIGRRRRRLLPWRRGLAERIGELGAELDVMQIARPPRRHAADPLRNEVRAPAANGPRWRPYAVSAAACGLAALLASLLFPLFELPNIVMLFLLAVVGVALRCGRGPAVLAAFLSVAAFDFFFVQPRLSFNVSDIQYLVTFGVMLVVGLVIGQLTARLSFQAHVAQEGENRMRALYEMSRSLSAALLPEQVAEIGSRFLAAEFDARSALLVADDQDALQAPLGAGEPPELDAAVAHWCYQHRSAAGPGTDTLPAGATLYLPLRASMRVRGVLALQAQDAVRLATPEQRRLLETCASLLALALERLHYIEVAQGTTLQMESERLRNSLLAAISHDLRTPLASLVGLAEALPLVRPPVADQALEIADAIRDSALRMNALVSNLLDMARLEAGAVQLNRQWQPLEEVVGSALAAARPALAGRSVSVALPDALPLVYIDAVLIERVLVNVLENAAKYTPAGTPLEIAAAVAGDSVLLWLDDHGPGLPAGREEALFNKFERGARESATSGVGLGLAICRAIARAHGGDISGASRVGGGARFTLRLPRGEPPALRAPVEADEPGSAA